MQINSTEKIQMIQKLMVTEEMVYFASIVFYFCTFDQDLQNHEDKVSEVNSLAEKLITDGHPEEDTIRQKQQEVNEAWQRLRQLSLLRQERLYGAHEIQRFNR